MFEDKEEKYEAFSYKDEEEINVSESYTNRMLQKKRLERKQRKGNVWITRLHILLRLLILVGLSFALYYLVKAPQWYVDKNIFTTTSPNLQILNNEIVPTYKILNELRKIPVTTEPIYKFEIDKIRLNLLELEPIEDIYIRRFWLPARLQIIVKERVPVLSIYNSIENPAIAFFTQDGVLVGTEYLPLPATKPTTKIVASGEFREWDRIRVNQITLLASFIEKMANEPIEFINMQNAKDVYVKLPSVTLRIGAIDESVMDRVSILASILPKYKSLGLNVSYIDLRWKDTSYIKYTP